MIEVKWESWKIVHDNINLKKGEKIDLNGKERATLGRRMLSFTICVDLYVNFALASECVKMGSGGW